MKPTRKQQYQGLSQVMFLLAWLLFLGLLIYFFSSWIAYQHNPNRDLNSLITQEGIREVVLKENRSHHFVFLGHLNGGSVEFMLDTGASNVSIPGHLAKTLHLKPGYPIRARTANGTITVYTTIIEVLEIGPIRLHNVRASINPHMPGKQVLLGMSVLRQLEFTLRDGHLILKQHPKK